MVRGFMGDLSGQQCNHSFISLQEVHFVFDCCSSCDLFKTVGIDMTDRNRQGVRGVSLGDFRQSQQRLQHLLNLALLGPALADHRLFDLQRRIFGHRQTGVYCCNNGRSAGLPQLERTLNIVGEKDIFHRDLIRMVLGNYFRKSVEDAFKSARKICSAVGEDSAVVHMNQAIALLVDNSVTGYARTRVYTENSHLEPAPATMFLVVFLMILLRFPEHSSRSNFSGNTAFSGVRTAPAASGNLLPADAADR